MQAGAIFLSEFHSLARRSNAGLLTANQGMQVDLWVVTPGLLNLLHITVDDAGILPMYHQRQLANPEDVLQSLLLVNQHITRRRPHKQLDARNTFSR